MSSVGMILSLLEKASLIIVLFLLLTRERSLKNIFKKDTYSFKDLLIISFIFSGLGIFGTYNGIPIEGSLANTRIISIVSGGIIFGPLVGIISALIAGFHRYIIDIGNVTALPCLISTVFAGVLAGVFYQRGKSQRKWFNGILCGVISENITMLLIFLMSGPKDVTLSIIQQIYFPMIIGQIAIGFVVLIVEQMKKEKEEVASYYSQLALNIANKTLPYFRSINSDSLRKICLIIKDEIQCDAVSITDTQQILAYVGTEEEIFQQPNLKLSVSTKKAIAQNQILNIQVKESEQSIHEKANLKAGLIIPLTNSQEVIGTLKIYYQDIYDISELEQSLAIGLSTIISTLMEISKLEQIKEEKNIAEIKALQRQINPHFLFNALNTITSFIRINPNKARELIINLSTYMRYNIEISENLIDLAKELEQVKAYIEIEKARFGEKLQVVFDIDEVDQQKIPSLIIQPLVENAIIHGIRQKGGAGLVTIGVKQLKEKTKIWIEDNGISIDQKIIQKVYTNQMTKNKIGLYNVHHRLQLIYGHGLTIKRTNPGTLIEFYI